MREPIRVRILDQEYLVKTEEDESRVREIANLLDEVFEEIRGNTEGLSDRKMIMLAAFQLASKYLQLQKQRDKLMEEIRNRVQRLNSQIDSAVS